MASDDWSSSPSFSRSHSAPRSRPSSPRISPTPPSPPIAASRFSSPTPSPSAAWQSLIGALRRAGSGKARHGRARKRKGRGRWRRRGILVWAAVVVLFFVMNWWMFSRLQDASARKRNYPAGGNLTDSVVSNYGNSRRVHKLMFTRLLALAAHALAEAEHRSEPRDLWHEYVVPTASWTPCADQRVSETYSSGSSISNGNNGYIMVSANGGINQQRIAICNAVAIARLLNSTLVLPHFQYSSVWRDNRVLRNIDT